MAVGGPGTGPRAELVPPQLASPAGAGDRQLPGLALSRQVARLVRSAQLVGDPLDASRLAGVVVQPLAGLAALGLRTSPARDKVPATVVGRFGHRPASGNQTGL